MTKNCTVITPPSKIKIVNKSIYSPKSIFLAGTIDNGESVDWQTEMCDFLSDENVYIYNPRRDDWDSTWLSGSPQLLEQINWELDHLSQADIIVINILDESKSPITLLEMGLFINSDKKIFISCPPEFYRYDNIKVVCERYNVKLYNNYNDMKDDLKAFIQ